MESKFVQAGAVSLQYYEEGSGPETIVLVHGYASSAVLWRYTVEQLAREQMDGAPRFRIIAFNNRGAGDSGRAGSEDGYTVESFAVDLHNAVSALELNDFLLVGHSMGGAHRYAVLAGAPGIAPGPRAAELRALSTGGYCPKTGRRSCAHPLPRAA